MPSAQDSSFPNANRVAKNHRMTVLPRHFGGYFMVGENALMVYAKDLIEEYDGGYWEFYQFPVTEEGKEMQGFIAEPTALPASVKLACPNYYEAEVSRQVASIVVCLYAFSHLSMLANEKGNENIAEHIGLRYHWLLDYARANSSEDEYGQIRAAID